MSAVGGSRLSIFALSAKDDGDAKAMTGVNQGVTRVTYTLGEKSTYSDINVRISNTPSTGQDFTWAIVLGALGLLALIGALLTDTRKKQKVLR